MGQLCKRWKIDGLISGLIMRPVPCGNYKVVAAKDFSSGAVSAEEYGRLIAEAYEQEEQA